VNNFIKLAALIMAGYVLIEFGPRAAQFFDDVHAFRQQSESWQQSVDGIKQSIDEFKLKLKFWEPAPGDGDDVCGCGCGKPGCTCSVPRNKKR